MSGPGLRAVVALGSNLGDRATTLQEAVDRLIADGAWQVTAVSRVYETEPVGGPEQGRYLNAVIAVEGDGVPAALLARCQEVEAALGRERTVRWGPRTVDLDIVDVADVVQDDPALTLPHPRAHLRAFVLVPWLDVDPAAELPGRGRVADLAARAEDRDGLSVRPDLSLKVA